MIKVFIYEPTPINSLPPILILTSRPTQDYRSLVGGSPEMLVGREREREGERARDGGSGADGRERLLFYLALLPDVA